MKKFYRHISQRSVSEIVTSVSIGALIIPDAGTKWSDEQKSNYIANIFKNFSTGIYVITSVPDDPWKNKVKDGCNRVQAIVDFTDSKIMLPRDFNDDDYGYEPLAGKTYSEIIKIAETDSIASKMIGNFWGYMLNIEFHKEG